MPSDIPPAPADRPQTGTAAWEALREEVEAVAELPARMPSVNLQRVSTGVLRFHRLRLTPERAALLERLSPEGERGEVAAAIDRLPTLALACDHAASMLARDASVGRDADLIERSRQQRDRGLFWVELLERMGHLPAGTLAAIRAGRGHADLAGDLQAIARHLRAHWSTVQALTAHLSDASRTLSADDLDAMDAAGAQILDRAHDDAQGTDWRHATLALVALLSSSYTHACAALTYHLRRLGRDAEADDLPRFLGLDRVEIT